MYVFHFSASTSRANLISPTLSMDEPQDLSTTNDEPYTSEMYSTKSTTKSHAWQDVTQEFFESIKELQLGELVHHEFFGLFEAMSAIEMMDPKMDAGMCCNKDMQKPLDFNTALQTGALKLDNFTNAEIIGIFDAIIACVISWLEGHSMAQTVFTCLYLHHPHTIIDKSLKAYCFGIHKLVDYISRFVV